MSEEKVKVRFTTCRPFDGWGGLRDKMAAAALTGMLANPTIMRSRAQIVNDAWAIADSMIDQRDADREGNLYSNGSES